MFVFLLYVLYFFLCIISFLSHYVYICDNIIDLCLLYVTSDCPDYVVNECINVGDVLPDDYVTDVPLVRCSEDTGSLTNYGSLALDLCK